MAEPASRQPATTEGKAPERRSALEPWRPFENLRQEMERLFDEFDRELWRTPFRRSMFDIEPFWRRELGWGATPAVDIVEKEDAYEVTAELPGMDEKDIEIKLTDRNLTIKGRKQEEKEEKEKNYYLHERRMGSFERRFAVPESVDADKIQASFRNGILTLTLPKKPEAQKAERKIEVKTT